MALSKKKPRKSLLFKKIQSYDIITDDISVQCKLNAYNLCEVYQMDNLKIPNHVAVIMDGNGRWAKAKGLPRKMGHVQGGKNVEDMLYVCDELGIKYFTVYAFSTENWKRSEDEVSALMTLLRSYLSSGFKKAAKNNVRIRIIGDRTRLAKDIQDLIRDLEEDSKNNTGLQFQIAINYGSRDEIRRMMQDTAKKIKDGYYPEQLWDR